MFGNTGFIHYAPHGYGPKGATTDPTTHKRYTTRTICEAFAKGATTGKAGALRIDGGVLYSYAEPIAVKVDPPHIRMAYVTADRFSRTTTRHTHLVTGALLRNGWTVEHRHGL